MKTVHIGTRLLDAANPADNYIPDHCAICGSADQNTLHVTNLDHADLARIGLRSTRPILCLPHYRAALESVGVPSPAGNATRCTACASHGVIATWPLQSFAHNTVRACRPCLIAAVRALLNPAPTTQDTP